MEERFLPIGIQDFEDLRRRGCVYVDKTSYVYNLAREGKAYFLSRPRRFGKSLLLSTMEAYFLGKKELFRGLALERLEKNWEVCPVIKISFGGGSFDNTKKLFALFEQILCKYEEQYGIEKKSSEFFTRFAEIITTAYEKTGKQVAVIIDEYDKPVLDALYSEYEEKNRAELRAFYSPLKELDQYIRFLFITGITKISHMNIFSGLNQLNDISLMSKYSSICGISESELNAYFVPEIEALANRFGMTVEAAKEKLKTMYDGYHFSFNVEGVYNPFCLLKCFFDCDFGSYWFQSGTPSMLVKALQNQPLELETLVNGREVDEISFREYDPNTKNMLPVIYQSGYLTIKGFDAEDRMFWLDFPNREVEQSFLKILLAKYVSVPYDDMGLEISNLRNALRNKDVDRVCSMIKAAVADLPTIVKKDICENYYESVTHLMFRLSGMRVVSELQNVNGRSDVVVTTKDAVFIFELKMDKGKDVDEVAQAALAQIDANGYAERFAVSGKQMFKVALVFSSDGKRLLLWKVR